MSDPLRLVVFDVDGTLVDSRTQIVQCMQLAFTDVGLPVPADQAILRGVGLSLPEMMHLLVPIEPTDVKMALVEAYRAQFFASQTAGGRDAEPPFFPGMRAVLDHLRTSDFTLLAMATGKSRRGLDRMIAHHGLGGYFQSTQVADNHPSKPNPSMLDATLSETGVLAQNAVMIGDTSYDMMMGKAAGFHTVGVSWGYHSVEELADANVIVDTADQLVDCLNTWMERLI
jgi:phosphoglycolate phosphatase